MTLLVHFLKQVNSRLQFLTRFPGLRQCCTLKSLWSLRSRNLYLRTRPVLLSHSTVLRPGVCFNSLVVGRDILVIGLLPTTEMCDKKSPQLFTKKGKRLPRSSHRPSLAPTLGVHFQMVPRHGHLSLIHMRTLTFVSVNSAESSMSCRSVLREVVSPDVRKRPVF